MSRCKRCGVLIDFDDECAVRTFEACGECNMCENEMQMLEEIDSDVRSKWMDNNGDSSEGL